MEKSFPVVLPEQWRARLELGALRFRIPRILGPTLSKTLERFQAGLGSGWVDMKFDPRDGGERDQGIDFYRKDRVYGWIQGRSLESLAAHAAWLRSVSPPDLPAVKDLLASGEALYKKLISVCLPAAALEPRFHFVMDIEGQSLFKDEGDETTSLSQLFALRGLYAFAAMQGKNADLERIGPLLRHAADEASRGRCRNDQVFFDLDGGIRRPPPRRGYEGQMIALGACDILFSQEGREEDLKRADAIVESVLSDFLYTNSAGEPTLVEYLDGQGRPLPEGGRVRSNPGHAVEFAGLSQQLSRRARRPLGSARSLELLRRIAWRCAGSGRAPHGGIYRSIDAEDGSPVDASCPWWSSFEAARTFAELSIAAVDDTEKLRCAKAAASFADTIETAYLGPSSLGIPVQTISADGKVLPLIPATPDLDSGYHNGIPLLDVLEVIDEAGCLFCGAAEAELPARLGVLLQGHIARTGKAGEQLDPLKVRACRLAASGGQVLLVSADVLEFSKGWAKRMERALSAACGIHETEVFLFATHTHTAPAAIELGQLKRDKTFLRSLENAMFEAVRAASQAMAPAAPLFVQGKLGGLGVNRRASDPATGKIVMRPNPQGPLDDSVSSLFFVDAAGAPKALLFNMAIHPTSLGVSMASISADYPGLAAGLLGEALGGAIAVPLQGACGDLRPNITTAQGAEFAEGSYEDARRIAAGLANTLLASLADALRIDYTHSLWAGLGQTGWLDSCAVKVRVKNAPMPFGSPPSLAELDTLIARCEAQIRDAKPPAPGARLAAIHGLPSAPSAPGFAVTQGASNALTARGFSATHDAPLLEAKSFLAWARRVKRQSFDAQGRYKGPKFTRARFGLVSLGKELHLFAVPGELFCRIGMDLKKSDLPAKLLVCGYSGGTLGYIPSEEAFSQGGYEVESAYRYYGAPAALSPNTETRIHAIFEVLRREVDS